ncbi:unnamed protein product [Orchesella dallaii]
MPAKGVIPVQRGSSRGLGFGGGLGGLGGGGFNGNMMRTQQGKGWALGPMFIPPPPPTSRPPPKVMELAPKQEVKLHEAEKPWKPGRRRGAAVAVESNEEKSEEEIFVEAIVKEARSILNKLTPENFDRLKLKFMELKLENKENRVAAVINVLFEKAIDEPAFSASYAKMVHAMCAASDVTSKIFRKQLLDKCQREFQKSNLEEDKIRDATKAWEDEEDKEKKQQMKLDLDDLKFKSRRRSLGNVRFIGELYKLQMLSAKIMVECVKMLLATPDEDNLECLCKLLATVGQRLDESLAETEARFKNVSLDQRPKFLPEEKCMDKFFDKLDKLSGEKKISSRIRFAIMDIVELRQCKWKPRRDTAGPKTIEEVHRDAYLQEMEEKRQINSLPPTSPEGGPSQRGGRQSPISMQGKKGEWMKISSTKSTRFQVNKKTDQQSKAPILGPPTGGPIRS